MRIELVGRQKAGLPPPGFQPLHGADKGSALPHGPAQARPQRSPPITGKAQPHKIVVVERAAVVTFQQRAFQNAGQRQIVLPVQQEATQRHEILHCQMIGHFQPVCAGHRHALLLQRGDDGVHEIGAAAQQDEEVPMAHRAESRITIAHRHAPRHEIADRAGDAPGQSHARMVGCLQPLRRPPGIPLHAIVGAEFGQPHLHQSRSAVPDGEMGLHLFPQSQIHLLQHRIHRLQDDWRGAEGNVHFLAHEADFGGSVAGLEPLAHDAESRRLRPLERIDGLFEITDGENGAGICGIPRPLPGAEFLGQQPDDLPLFR